MSKILPTSGLISKANNLQGEARRELQRIEQAKRMIDLASDTAKGPNMYGSKMEDRWMRWEDLFRLNEEEKALVQKALLMAAKRIAPELISEDGTDHS